MKKYQVIGGQYMFCHYGEADTLKGAMRIARKHEEYWDNWQGWHVPSIYSADDCYEGQFTEWNFDGIFPKPGAEPVAVCDYYRNEWSKREA